MDTYIGFDSAWTDNRKAPGAICAVSMSGDLPINFDVPVLASFDEALAFIRNRTSENGNTLVAIDQPTVVPNLTGMRPVDRVAASLVSWLGGGVQPANRGKLGMFCNESPIWRFLPALGAVQDPEQARAATSGLYLMEVFPAIALASLDTNFFGRLRRPRYNPGRKAMFRIDDWRAVAEAAAHESHMLGCEALARWCREVGKIEQPRKADQDRLDSALCVLVALRWRLRARSHSLLIGDLKSGYMVLPVVPAVRERLATSARKYSVPIDGI
jgi:predicted RNase H-like nuclease